MKRVDLRPMVVEDVLAMLHWPRYEHEDAVWANIRADSAEEAAKWLSTYHQPPRCYALAATNSQGLLVGRTNLAFLDEGAKIGGLFNFTIRRDLADQGYGQGALTAIREFSFGPLGLSALYLYTPAANSKARHLYEKFGFETRGVRYEGREGQTRVEFIDYVAWNDTKS